MRRHFWLFLTCALIFANVAVASAHNWWYWTWGRSDMHVFLSTRYDTAAEAARADWAYPHTHLSLMRSSRHADISVIDADYGLTQWTGLATVEEWGRYWPFLCGNSPACRFVHAHARFNTSEALPGGANAQSGIRGVFCQEIGHTLGLNHVDRNDCMGKRYFKGNDSNVTGPHAWADVNARY